MYPIKQIYTADQVKKFLERGMENSYKENIFKKSW